MFLRGVILEAKHGLPTGAIAPRSRLHAIFQQHGAACEALAIERRRHYEEQARLRADEREHELHDEYAFARSQLTLAKRRLANAHVETRAKLATSGC